MAAAARGLESRQNGGGRRCGRRERGDGVPLDELEALAHRHVVHAVGLDPGNNDAASFVVVRVGGRSLNLRSHPVPVVLAHKDQRQLLERRQVDRLEQLALVRSAIAIQREGHTAIVLVLVREREPRAEATEGQFWAAILNGCTPGVPLADVLFNIGAKKALQRARERAREDGLVPTVPKRLVSLPTSSTRELVAMTAGAAGV